MTDLISLGGCHGAELDERLSVWSKEIMRSAEALKNAGAHEAAGGNERLAEDLRRARDEIRRLQAIVANPPKHVFWGAGEADCPREIKAGNGELHTLKCKICGAENPRAGSICQ